MSELPLKEAIEILTQEKKKVELKLARVYDSFCLYPNEADQNDWDRFSALDSAFEMAISALKKQIPKKPKMPLDEYWVCPMCGRKVEYIYRYGHCMSCGQVIDWTEGEK